jgi:hypothetical protein
MCRLSMGLECSNSNGALIPQALSVDGCAARSLSRRRVTARRAW